MFASRGFFVVLNDKWDPNCSFTVNTSKSNNIWKLQFGVKGIILISNQTGFINRGLNFGITSKLPHSEEYNWGCASCIYCRKNFLKKTFRIDKDSIHYGAVLPQRVFSGLQCAFGKLRSMHQGPSGRETPQSKRRIWARWWIHMQLLEARLADGAVDILLRELRSVATILPGTEDHVFPAWRRAVQAKLGFFIAQSLESFLVFWVFEFLQFLIPLLVKHLHLQLAVNCKT